MTTNPKRNESQMLDLVREWRRQAYEADQKRTPKERDGVLRELAEQFGLPMAKRVNSRDRES